MFPTHIDDASARIIQATMFRPRTAVQIANATGVPVAQVFHRIRRLKAVGFLREEVRVMSSAGREVPFFVSTLGSSQLFMEGERSRIRLSASMDRQGPDLGKLL